MHSRRWGDPRSDGAKRKRLVWFLDGTKGRSWQGFIRRFVRLDWNQSRPYASAPHLNPLGPNLGVSNECSY